MNSSASEFFLRVLALIAGPFFAVGAAFAAAPAAFVPVYIGTWAEGDSRGIYLCHLDPATGVLTFKGRAVDAERPGFVAIHPNGRFLYAITAGSQFREQGQGGVAAFSIDAASGRLQMLNEVPSMGAGPTHVNIDASGRTVFVANYAGGNIASYPVLPDGRLGPAVSAHQHAGSSVHPQRQTKPYAHSTYAAPGGRFAVSADLGIDKIMIYRLDPGAARLEPNNPSSVDLPPGSGPRHLAFHPEGRRLFSINELNSTVTMFSWDGRRGELRPISTVSTLPAGADIRNTGAEIVVHPSGQFVYSSNRGHDSIAIFRYDAAGDRLVLAGTEPTQGGHPRHFNIDPSGRWLIVANRDSEDLVIFGIDPQTGSLTPTGQKVSVPRPVCVQFLGAGG